MSHDLFSAFCRKGEAADALYNKGLFIEAHDAYAKLLLELENSRVFDSYLLSKITLGLLLTHIRSGKLQLAFTIWNANMEESLFGIGIYALEHAQTSIQDMLLYDFVCACLHSFSGGNKDGAASAVNQYMSRICEHLHEQADSATLRLAISNWKTHLKEIFGNSIPHRLAEPLITAERDLKGEPLRLQALGFPSLSGWEKPEGFREMSHLISFEPLEFRVSNEHHSHNADGATARKIQKK